MAIERGLIRQGSRMELEAKARALVMAEAAKGCSPVLATAPLALEPSFRPIRPTGLSEEADANSPWVVEVPPAIGELVRLRVWVSPEQQCDWGRSEMLLRQLQGARHRVWLELAGNNEAITFNLCCHQEDLPTLSGAFAGTFECCELRVVEGRPTPDLKNGHAPFFDFFPPPPYSHLLTRPPEFVVSPYATIIRAMAEVTPPATALFQVVFQAVDPQHDWHRNVQVLLDLEFAVKLLASPFASRFAQQTPSGDLRQMAMDTETKAHNDKPFYAAAMRLAVFGGETAERHLQAMAAFSGLIQHGGRPLERLDQSDYAETLDGSRVRAMFAQGLTYRPGFLVNSAELTSLVHIPPATVLQQRQAPIEVLEMLNPSADIAHGSPLGYCNFAGRRQPVCCPREQRFSHTHIIGRTGEGKSTLMGHLILDDIERGDGVAVIDPQGQLIEQVVQRLPQRHVERTIYIDFSDPDVVPIFNPLRTTGKRRWEQLADEIVVAFKSFVTGWGDRLEHLLRMTILGLLHVPHTSLLDVANALRTKSTESETLRAEVLKVADSELLRAFWRDDLGKYARADLTPPQHKLSKLLSAGPLALMLSQPDSLIDLRQVMDEGKILLLNLKDVGDEVCDFAGCLWLSLLRAAVLTREPWNPDARPFHIHVDEAHRFMTQAMEQIVTETRKFSAGMTLAHHYLSQFDVKQRDAVCSVGTTIIRNVDAKDAAYLCKDLQGRVEPHDITKLDRTTAIARIGTEVVRFKTLPPREPTGPSHREEIVAYSRKHFYRSATEVKKAIRERQRRWDVRFAPLAPPPAAPTPEGADGEELHYDEF